MLRRALLAVLLVLGGLHLHAAPARALETQAREAILYDMSTGTVLFEKNADELMPPASMSKIMTVYMVFERLKDGRLSLDDTFTVSEKAWKKGGSKMFVEVGEEVRVEDLLRGITVQSGNDACIVIAEGLAGSEAAFAEEMTRKARELGMTRSAFRNATGWPHPEHLMTARELAMLAEALIRNFPEYYHYFAEKEFTWAGIRQMNRNPLLYRSIPVDGLKTGHTEEAGYGLTASAEQDGRRLILVVTGLPSMQARADEADRLLSWGFREFANYALVEPNETVEEAPVWLGAEETVPLVAPEGVTVTLSRAARDDMQVKVVYESPIPAPIAAGQRLATLQVEAPGMTPALAPLVAGSDVERLGPFGRLFASVKFLVFGAP